MTREEAREAAKVMLAYAEGKDIEYATFSGWRSFVNKEPIFDWYNDNYRIKPEAPTPTYRPFANAQECWEEMQKHEPFGWVKSSLIRKTIDIVFVSKIHTCEGSTYTFEEAHDKFTFADGTPFGKLEEE